MDYQEALDYVLSFADFERWPGAGYAERWDLRRVESLLGRLGSPHLGRRTVHIAGSKGKGSTAAMIASGLTAAGLRTGLYTSPHLHTMRERIRIGDALITEEEFARIVSEVEPAVEAENRGAFGELSTFEILTTLAFCHFNRQEAQSQVLETGLGGRLDATNVCRPEVCVLTSISQDHTAVLGDTIGQIAGEKAGIIKRDAVVISSPQDPEAAGVIRTACAEKGVPLVVVGEDVQWRRGRVEGGVQAFEVQGLKDRYALSIPLLGQHQIENAAVAVAVLEAMGIDRQAIVSGLARTRWAGRMQILGTHPLLIADGAHNGDSVRRLLESLRTDFEYDRSILIIGTSADKNVQAMVEQLAPFFDEVIATMSQHPRASSPEGLADDFVRLGASVRTTRTVPEAVACALELADEGDLVCATGSLFLVAEVIEAVQGIPGERYPKKEETG